MALFPHGETLHIAVSFLSVADIGRAAAVPKGFEAACAADALWEGLCERHWANQRAAVPPDPGAPRRLRR